MKIGIDASRAFVKDPTGTERYSFELITRLMTLPEAKRHTWVLYVRPNFQFPISNFQSNSNFKFQIINLPCLWTQLGLAWRTWRDGLDVLWVPAHTLPVLRKPGIKTVVTIHGIEYEWLPAYENLLQRWYLPLSTQYAVKSATKIIAVSEFTKKQLIERLGARGGKIEVIHEGAAANFQFPISNFQSISKKYNLQKHKYLLFVGTVQPRKNLVRLIRAYLELTSNPSLYQREGNKRGELKLVIAGKLGWNYEEVVELAKRYRVTMVGYINETDRYTLLQNALVYVQPSITEGFGLPVLEAMAVGVPVVSSNGGALPEVVGNAGLLFDPYDVDDMAKKLSVVISDYSLRLALIKKGKRRLAFFDWDMAAERTYNTLISKL